MKTRAVLAELFGTFALTLAVLISLNNPLFPVPTAVVAGLTLGLFVYAIGPISECHINPAVTLGLLSIRRVDATNALAYVARSSSEPSWRWGSAGCCSRRRRKSSREGP